MLNFLCIYLSRFYNKFDEILNMNFFKFNFKLSNKKELF